MFLCCFQIALSQDKEVNFDQSYIQANKDCYKHNQISCNQCGSKSIHFQKFYGAEENIPFSKYKAAIYNRHFCKQCSNTLFYTPLNY